MPVKLRKTLLALRWFFAKTIISSCTPKKTMEIRETRPDDEDSFEFEFESDDSDELSDVENLPFHSGLI